MSVAVVMTATGELIRRRLNLGKYPEDKVASQRVVMWGFFLMGPVVFLTALLRSLTY